jgi:hypothetical protein
MSRPSIEWTVHFAAKLGVSEVTMLLDTRSRWLMRLLAAAAAAVSAVYVSDAHAQEARGAITGRVTDSSGAAVPGATVTATNLTTNLAVSAVSDAAGSYNLLYLPPAQYSVVAELAGFKKVAHTGIEVRVADRLTLNFKLEPGELRETVEVTASTPLLEASTGSAGQVIDSKRIQLLPLSDGNPFVLSRLAPGVAYTGDLKFSRPFDNAGTSSITADGAPGNNEFTIDGTPNLIHGRRVGYVPPSDAVEEFKVETATYDAQQGHSAGANVNVAMKSGTNKLRGTLYEFYRDEKLSANDFFLNKAGRERAPLDYNRFGASLGGPIVLPGYNGRDKTFFFLSYEGIFDEFPEPGQFTVPTDAMRRGDFSALLSQGIVIYDPLTAVRRSDGRIERRPFPGNIIPANRISPIAQAYLNLYPSPNQPGDAQGRNNFIGPNGRGDDFHALSGRVDHRLSDKHRFFLRYSWNDRVENRGNWTGVVGGVKPTGNFLYRVNHNATYDHIYTRSASTLLNLRFGFSRFEEPNVRQHEGLFDPKSLGFSSSTAGLFGSASYVPRFEISGMSALGDSLGGARYTNVYSVQPTLTKIVGSHNVKLGYDFRVHQDNNRNPGHAAGRYDFAQNFTRQLDNSPSAPVGQGFAAFLLGQPTGGLIDRNASRANQSYYNGIFVQDDWRVSPKLTLNLGLRYDYETPITERFDRTVRNFDPNAASPIAAAARAAYAANPIPEIAAAAFQVQGGLTFPTGGERSQYKSDKNNIQPRVGFAYQLDDKTVVRGGWAIYTVPNLLETFDQSGFSQATNLVPTLDTGLTFAANLANPFPNGVAEPPGASLGAGTFLGRGLGDQVFLPGAVRKNEMSMRWSIGFQRELPGQWVFEASYVGNRGYDLTTSMADGTNVRAYVDVNAVPARYLSTSPVRDANAINFLTANVANPFRGLMPGTGMDGATVQRQQLLRPYPQFTNVRTERREGESSYQSAQFRLEKRFTGSYTVLLGYTWSRFRDKSILLNPTDAAPQDYLAAGDIPHRLVTSAIWELPFGSKRRFDLGKAGNALFAGWSVQGIFNLQSGRPLNFGNVYFNGDPSKLKANYDDPDRIFDTSGFYFNDAAVQRNGVVDPALQRADQRIRLANNVRTFPLRPGMRGPAYYFLDYSLIKTIQFTEDVKLQLRFEAINGLNHPVFNNPNTDPTNSNFGKSTGQFNIPRNYQLGVRLFF